MFRDPNGNLMTEKEACERGYKLNPNASTDCSDPLTPRDPAQDAWKNQGDGKKHSDGDGQRSEKEWSDDGYGDQKGGEGDWLGGGEDSGGGDRGGGEGDWGGGDDGDDW